MNYIELESQINYLLKQYEEENNDKFLDDIVELYESFILDNPSRTNVILEYAIFLYEDMHDDYKALDVLKNILDNDPNNIQAALIMAYFDFTLSHKYEVYSLQKLCELKTNDSKLLSMIEFTKALYYSRIDDYSKYEESLKRSIEYYDKHVRNNFSLGMFYLRSDKIENAKKLIKKSFDSIQLIYIYPSEEEVKITTVDEFLAEHIKGVYITIPNLETIEDTLKKIED